MKLSKFAIPALIMVGMLAMSAYAEAQVIPENQPPVESAWAAKVKAPYRLSTIMRPGTSTGISRDTPNGRVNWYKQPAN